MNNQGQVGIGHIIQTLMGGLVGMIIYVVTYPLFSSVIDTFLAGSTDPILNILIRLFPLFFLIGMLIWFFETIGMRSVLPG